MQNKESPRLRECPFCGGKASVEIKWGNWFLVRCNNCPCDLGRSWFPKKRQAIEAWNRRSDTNDST